MGCGVALPKDEVRRLNADYVIRISESRSFDSPSTRADLIFTRPPVSDPSMAPVIHVPPHEASQVVSIPVAFPRYHAAAADSVFVRPELRDLSADDATERSTIVQQPPRPPPVESPPPPLPPQLPPIPSPPFELPSQVQPPGSPGFARPEPDEPFLLLPPPPAEPQPAPSEPPVAAIEPSPSPTAAEEEDENEEEEEEEEEAKTSSDEDRDEDDEESDFRRGIFREPPAGRFVCEARAADGPVADPYTIAEPVSYRFSDDE
jgi:hypothetical protein